MNIVDTIREETRHLTNHTAIVEGEQTITYGELLARINGLSQRLAVHKIVSGQRIAFRCSDGIDHIIGALALLQCGAAVIPVADSLTPAEIHETVVRIDVHGILSHRSLPHAADETSTAEIDETFLWYPRTATDSALDARCRELLPAFIRFSSGTTGQSKGVALCHRSIIERTDAANQGLGVTDRDVILWVLGMSHHFVVSILLFMRKGATIIVANRNFPFSVLQAAGQHPITLIYASPVHYYLLGSSDLVAPGSLSKVRLAISTAMKMPREISARFAAKFGIVPAEAYGIIEIGLPFINVDPHEAEENSVGRILPDFQLRIASPDADGIGEVLLKGKGMFDAYVSPWRTRSECLDDGWFHTGDLGRLDAQGRLTLLGRSKTVIVCAGMKVFPEEVEETINAIPGVAESLVFGREHPQFGQTPIAQVVLRTDFDGAVVTAESLRAVCLERLSSYKVPVEFQIVESLPKTTTGKLLRQYHGFPTRAEGALVKEL
jgi:long-chain acyl-CoA synthetase